MLWRGQDDGDLMFADPLNVRSCRDQPAKGGFDTYRNDPFRGQGYPHNADSPASSHSTPSPVRADRRQNAPEPEVEDYGVVGNFFWSLVTGGKQCCSMRDRAKAADMEAKARLPETNRPPGHPDRVNSGNVAESEGYGQGGYPRSRQQQQQQQQQQQRQGRQPHGELDQNQRPNTPTAAKESSHPSGRSDSSRTPDQAGGRPPYRGQDLASSLFDTHEELDRDLGSPPRDGPGDQERVREAERGNETKGANPMASSKTPSERRWDDDPFLPSTPRQPSSSSNRPPSLAPPSASASASPLPQQQPPQPPPPPPPPQQFSAPTAPQLPGSAGSAGKLMPGWEWPTWALNFKRPSVEVWVFDDDTGEGRWVNAEPQSRVVDKSGKDAYLCAEYEWDGEYYMQDFGPEHVRKRGSRQTVEDELKTPEPTEDLESTRLAPGRTRGSAAPDLLQDTRLAPGRSRVDNGAGVLPFLNEK